MKRLIVLLTFTTAIFALGGCSNYDSYRITQIERHKQNTHEGIQRALDGKLTRVEYESILQSFDTSAIEEQAKKGDGLEELEERLTSDSKKKADELFPNEEE
jgi:hypothetical protein